MSKQNLTITVDGGGSNCRLAAFDSHRNVVASSQTGPASLSLGAEQAWTNIRSGLSSIAEQLGLSAEWFPDQLWMGLAGTLQRERYEKFIQLIPTSIKAIVVPDGHAQLLGASNSEAGICLSLGTGSVIHWLDTSGKFGKAGGWGFPIGDEASGAWLGAQLVNEYIWYRDKNLNSATAPTIFIDLEQRIGKSVSDIQVWSTMTRSTQLASLAPIVTKHADTGDPIAIKLLDRGAGHCQQLIDIAPTELPLYVVGGLADVYLPRLKTRYAERCQPATGNALSGLYALSKSNSVSELSSKPS